MAYALKNISTAELWEELKKRGLGIYPLNTAFIAGIKFPITNRKHLKTEYKNESK